MDPPGHHGKHTTLDDARESQILDWAKQNVEQQTSATKGEIRDYCTAPVQIPVTRGWATSFVLRHSGAVIQIESTSQDEQHLRVSRAFLERTIQHLNEHPQGGVADLVVNVDEIGIADWEGRKTRKVVVPATMDGHTLHHSVPRNVKDISVIVCM
jgi:type II secretory pathway component PulJ